jgi:hypothetical protein
MSISPKFYEELLYLQIPKDTDNLTVFFALLGSSHVKALSKHVDEIDPSNFCTITLTLIFLAHGIESI